ncbi:MAG TPA: sigma-70 family RNA polymerase sigma factor [Candidatus Bipolaricaulota bacterium]
MTLKERGNQQWIQALNKPGPSRDAALADLRAQLLKGLRYALPGRAGVDAAALEDFAQEALLKILDKLDTFRGESKFTTWAQTVAVRLAFSHLRRRHWQDVSLDQMIEEANFDPAEQVDPTAQAQQKLHQERILEVMHQVINEQLTEKQRQALMAEFQHGMPLEVLAERMNTNRNALYKLLFDARRKLKKGLLASGLTVEEVRSAFEL